ncbi:MAG: TsoY family (seleno)protein [Saccharospirillum sp.]
MFLSLPESKGDRYSPLFLLASVGAGGLAVSFFMYLMFWVPHPGQPVPVFEDIASAFNAGSLWLQAGIVIALLGIAFFVLTEFRLLWWNLRELKRFRHSETWSKAARTNAETQMLALPLALAMAVNAAFIVGLVFVPGLWSVVEYLFPFAMLVFIAIGVQALRLIGRFMARVLTEGGFNCAANNSFAQMLPAFALAMTGVGLAAPAAMSQVPGIVALSLALSTLFIVASLIIAAVALILGFRAMMENGAATESAPTLMILVPLMTIVGIAFLRQGHALSATFDATHPPVETLMFLMRMLAVQLVFLGLGLAVLARQGYAKTFLFGEKRSAGSYALVCPGVALSVMLQFFINKGLVEAGIIVKFGITFWSLTAIALIVQAVTIALVILLNRKHFGHAELGKQHYA